MNGRRRKNVPKRKRYVLENGKAGGTKKKAKGQKEFFEAARSGERMGVALKGSERCTEASRGRDSHYLKRAGRLPDPITTKIMPEERH